MVLGFNSFSQNKFLIKGNVIDSTHSPMLKAKVSIIELNKISFTDKNGVFELKNLEPGNYKIRFEAFGYPDLVFNALLIDGEDLTLRDIQFLKKNTRLNTVTVVGRNSIQALKQQGFNVAAIDANKLHNTTYDLNQALNKVSGIRVRESGGLGSAFNFSLNGFSGNQVKFFMDGIPMDNFGTSFQMNNIPINTAERIEVYKGVVPVTLGGDALGGAINIVTSNKNNYLDASYSYGSFNTHRSAINVGYISKSGLYTKLNVFQNYSDNNYKVDIEVADLTTGIYKPMRVRRFNDNYRNETMIAEIGVVDKKYADKLTISATLGQNHVDIQTGNRMFDVYGARKRKGSTLMPTIKYLKKNLFADGLDISMNANYNLGYEQIIDTVNRQYNWLGEYRNKSSDPNVLGGELRRTLYKYKNNNASIISNISYRFAGNHAFLINHTFSSFNRKGEDELEPNNEVNGLPRKNQKYALGFGYNYADHNRLNLSLFVKNYLQYSVGYLAESVRPSDTVQAVTKYNEQHLRFKKWGYGAASSYKILNDLLLKASFERAYRLPDNIELFGNPATDMLTNFTLKPEKSNNVNVGVNYVFLPNESNTISFESNLIYRNSENFIRPTLTAPNGVAMLKMVNQRNVKTTGIDVELRYSFQDAFTAGVNITYQNIRNNTKYEINESTVSLIYKDRVPNMPYLYGNFNAQYSLKLHRGNKGMINFGYSIAFVQQYYLNWPSLGSEKLTIPEQFQHDLNVLYAVGEGRYNIGLECRNLLDANIYDNFSLQKPGRAFNIKVRYFISKNQ